jgi:uncharacterized protein
MGLQQQLLTDMQNAMRGGDVVRRDTIRMVRAAIRNTEIELQREATDEDVLQIISRQVKQRNESIEMFRQGGREDLVAEEEAQKAVLEEYLPDQLSEQEIEEVVREIVTELGANDMRQMGAVMRAAMQRLQGRADGSVVNQIVRDILS